MAKLRPSFRMERKMVSTWWVYTKHSHEKSLLHQRCVSDLPRTGDVKGNPWMTCWAGLVCFGFLVTKAERSVCSLAGLEAQRSPEKQR